MVTIQCGSVRFQAIEAIVFDKDGTLANSQDFLRNLGQKRARLIDAQIPGVQEPLLMAFGLNGKLNPAGLMAVGTRLENEIAAAAYIAETGRDWVEALRIARSAFEEAEQILKHKAAQTPLFEGTLDLLQRLAVHPIKVGILSADTTANVQDFIACYELESLVQLGIGLDAEPGKPDPTAFFKICNLLGVAPNAVLVVGDTIADLEMARAAQAAGFVGVSWGGLSMTKLAPTEALISNFAELQVVSDTL